MELSLFRREVCKYPGYTAEGKELSLEDAAEICVRTSLLPRSFGYSDAEEEFVEDFMRTFEVKSRPFPGTDIPDEGREDFVKKYKPLIYAGDLDQLSQRAFDFMSVASPPHQMWCNWFGAVGTRRGVSSGKWPKIHDYAREVRELAREFPFLEMRFQIWSEEHYAFDEPSQPVVEFVVWDGKWEMREPKSVIFKCDSRIEEEYHALDRACEYAKRRPVSHDYLRWASKVVRDRLKLRGVV